MLQGWEDEIGGKATDVAHWDAVAALYDNFERVDQRTRMLAYRDAMGRAAAKYPDDTETAAFYALQPKATPRPERPLEQTVDEIKRRLRGGEAAA